MLRSLTLVALLAVMMLMMPPSGAARAETRVPESPAEITLSFAPVAKAAAPAVVNIYARRVVAARRSPFSDDPFFSQFFGDPRPRVQNSLGSGVVLAEDGLLVSNYHVVSGATDIQVVLTDGREFSAEIVLADEDSDLAVLQMQGASDLTALSLRDSDTVEVGELVLAIGNPFGVGQTVSSGIVSGLARSGAAMGATRGYFIQTDAPINPGNSGGALVDMAGQLIGINTQILSRSGGSNGIGFAIPSALVAAFVEQARAGATRFQHPWLGLSGQTVSADLAEGLGLARPGGVIVAELHPASPFAAAGIMPGDVLRDVDGHAVNTLAEIAFRLTVSGQETGARIGFLREGQADAVTVQPGPAPEDPPRDALTTTRRAAIPGLTLATVNPGVIADYGLALSTQGVVITDPGPTGLRLGLRAGDLILRIDDTAIATSGDAQAALRAARGRITLLVQRGERRVEMRFRL